MNAQRKFEVFLARKPGLDEHQNARKRVENVTAESSAKAIESALAMQRNAAFRAVSVREAG